jgi:hypothetical protein
MSQVLPLGKRKSRKESGGLSAICSGGQVCWEVFIKDNPYKGSRGDVYGGAGNIPGVFRKKPTVYLPDFELTQNNVGLYIMIPAVWRKRKKCTLRRWQRGRRWLKRPGRLPAGCGDESA